MSDYVAIPLKVGPRSTQPIYVRKQAQSISNSRVDSSDSDADDDVDRTLFVTNLPLDTTEDNIRDICKALGDVLLDKYIYQGGRHGLISLVDESAASRFLSKAKKLNKKRDKEIIWEQYGPRGVEGYIAHHYSKFPEEHELQEKVDEYMELFAQQEEQERLEIEQAAERVDADGFRLVINKNRKRLADIPSGTVGEPQPQRKKRSLEKTDFYRFQLRDRQKKEMSDLLKQYQKDKEKVEELKQKKMYRPY